MTTKEKLDTLANRILNGIISQGKEMQTEEQTTEAPADQLTTDDKVNQIHDYLFEDLPEVEVDVEEQITQDMNTESNEVPIANVPEVPAEANEAVQEVQAEESKPEAPVKEDSAEDSMQAQMEAMQKELAELKAEKVARESIVEDPLVHNPEETPRAGNRFQGGDPKTGTGDATNRFFHNLGDVN